MPFQLSSDAENDIRGIMAYTLKTWGEKQVWRYYNLIIDTFESLVKNPYQPGVKALPYLNQKAKSFVIGSHRVIFTIDETQKSAIYIVRVLHATMDHDARFEG